MQMGCCLARADILLPRLDPSAPRTYAYARSNYPSALQTYAPSPSGSGSGETLACRGCLDSPLCFRRRGSNWMNARIEQRKPQAAQLALWETSDQTKTNMVALYDLAPRFVFDVFEGPEKPKIIEREFGFGGKRYRISLKPTMIKGPHGTTEKYLGEREQIVEEVIRRIATDRSRLTVRDGVKVRFPFTLTEVREELARVKHTYGLAEIREAIVLLNEVRITIEELDGKASLLSAAAFPVMAMRKGDTGETYVEFNPLVADAIRTLTFQQVNYDVLMGIRDPVSRWLMKRLHTGFDASGAAVQEMLASEIRRDSGTPEWRTTRNLLARMSRAVQVLIDKGLLDQVEALPVMDSRTKIDIVYTMILSPSFMTEVQRSRRIAKQNMEDFARLSGGAHPHEFVEVDPATSFKLRRAAKVEDAPAGHA